MEPVLVIDVAHAAWHAVRESGATARPFAALEARIDKLASEHPRCILALDSPPYDRNELLPSYKQHRTADPEARALVGAMLDGLRRSGRAIAERPGAEADDICATIARHCHEHGIPCTIATSDKDLAPLLAAAQVWDLRTGAAVTAETVRARWGVEPGQLHDLLALMGDASDGVPGVPDVGEKRAAVLLGAYGSLANLLAEPPIGETETAERRRDVGKLKRVAEKARKAFFEVRGDDPNMDTLKSEADATRALAESAAQALGVALLAAKVHAHRETVERARKLVTLDDEVPIDVGALLAQEGHDHARENGRDRSDGGASAAHVGGRGRGAAPGDRGVEELRRDPGRGASGGAVDEPAPAASVGGAEAARAEGAGAEAADESAGALTDLPPHLPDFTDVQRAAQGETMHETETAEETETTTPIRVAQPLALRPEPQPMMHQHPQRAAHEPHAVQEPQTRFRCSSAVGDLMHALAKAQGEIEPAIKESRNDHTKKNYADLASVWKAIRAPLSKHGIAVVQAIVDGHLVTRLYCGEQWIEGETKLALDTSTGRTPVQALGSAITYLRRYVLSSMVGVAPDDDDDGEGTRAIPPQRRGAA